MVWRREDIKYTVFFFEFLGTFILSMSFCTFWHYSMNFNIIIPFAAVSLLLCYQICSPICGGHFNPAITFASFLTNLSLKNLVIMLFVWVAQYTGAFCAMFLTRAFRIKTKAIYYNVGDKYYPKISWFGAQLQENVLSIDHNKFASEVGLAQIAFSEFFCSFIFCVCTLKLLWDVEKAGNKQNTLYFVSIALVYAATLTLDYPIATGVLNPAVGAAIVVQAQVW